MQILRYDVFLKVLEMGSFSKAAEYYGYTQSSVSQIVNQIEADLHTTLLIRSRAGIALTSEGNQLLPYISAVSGSHKTLYDRALELKGLHCGVLRIGAIHSISCHWLPKIIRNFTERYPGITFQLYQGHVIQIEEWLNGGKIDLGFMDIDHLEGYQTILLYKDPYRAILPSNHPSVSNKYFHISDLMREPVIHIFEGIRSGLQNQLKKIDLKMNIKYEVMDDYTLISMVENGLGLGFVPKLVLRKNHFDVVIKEPDIPIYRNLGMALKDEKTAPSAVQCFIKYVLEHKELLIE